MLEVVKSGKHTEGRASQTAPPPHPAPAPTMSERVLGRSLKLKCCKHLAFIGNMMRNASYYVRNFKSQEEVHFLVTESLG